jgi:uncharacterized membrane protein YGL010W
MSPALRSHFVEYARHHTTRGNRIRHYLAIPLIVLLQNLVHVLVGPLWVLAKATGRA